MRDAATALQEENEELRERLRQMEKEFAATHFVLPGAFRLTKSEELIVRHLLTRDLATRRSITLLLYSDRTGDEPDDIIVNVHISRIRKKLRPHGVEIENVWGRGWNIVDRVAVAERLS